MCLLHHIIDDFTHYGHVYLIFHKFEALECFRQYLRMFENKLDKYLKTLKTDNRREYLTKQFKRLFIENRIKRQLKISSMQQQNRVAKIKN